jgi:DNA gyrase/topoisomerase IV subunit A
MRYTEARLQHLGAALMDDMEKDTVDFVPNYDETRTEPTVLPAAFPNLLVNGGTGIAVGMATNMPPHNLAEVIDGICAQIDDPDITIDGLMQHVKGPDFPTGCEILGSAGFKSYFHTGKGAVRVRGKVGVVEVKGGREQLIISEIPYNVNRAVLVSRIADLVNDQIITDISAIRDESDENTRVVIDLKRDANPKVVINNLFKHTALESSFSASMLAIDHGKPKLLNLKDAITCYIEHRREVVLRRTRFLLREAEALAERLEALLIALANLDDFIKIIRDSNDRDDARAKLMALSWAKTAVEQLGILIRSEAVLTDGRYKFNERQSNAILDLRLYQLTGLEREAIKKEYDALLETIKDLLDILARAEALVDERSRLEVAHLHLDEGAQIAWGPMLDLGDQKQLPIHLEGHAGAEIGAIHWSSSVVRGGVGAGRRTFASEAKPLPSRPSYQLRSAIRCPSKAECQSLAMQGTCAAIFRESTRPQALHRGSQQGCDGVDSRQTRAQRKARGKKERPPTEVGGGGREKGSLGGGSRF